MIHNRLYKDYAVWNGMASGTKNTIDYAERKNVNIINVLEGY